jgi:DNA-binding SARP family transcriptional activator
MVLKMAFLGRMQLSLGDEPLENLVSAKAQALLCYLAVTGQTHSRQALAALLWGDLPDADARRNLRGVIMKLRQLVAPYLLISNQTVAFNQQSDYWLDVQILTKAAAQARQTADPQPIRQAINLYRGDFLEDFQVGYAPSFEDWVLRQQSTLQEMVLAGCLQAATAVAAQGQYEEGIRYLRRMLQIDPVREDGHRQLMLLLAQNDQRTLALSQYETCREILRAELGVEPSTATADLYQRIRDGEVNMPERPEVRSEERGVKNEVLAAAPPAFIAGPPVTHPARFFGREREIRRLFNLLKRQPLQNGAIIGPRRSGKTSLLHYLKTITTTAASQLRPTQEQNWLPDPSQYNWVFVDFQDHRLGELANLLPYLLEQMELPVPTVCDLDAFLDVVSQNLQRPTVILLDEMGVALQRYPELDDAFWESLRSLATNQVNGNLAFILASAEPPDQLAQHSGYGSPFFNIFGYMALLGPISEAAAAELIASAPQPIPPDDVAWILAESGRWPILLQILCRECLMAMEEGEADWRDEARQQLVPFIKLKDEG